jgi:Pectate lyase superfamily protein
MRHPMYFAAAAAVLTAVIALGCGGGGGGGSGSATAPTPGTPVQRSAGAVLTDAPTDKPADFYQAGPTAGNGVSVKDFGAKGDGVTDDTDAINRALNDTRVNPDGTPNQPSPDDYNGRPRMVYIPAGTYLVKNTLRWVGCCLAVRGDGPGRTVLKLADNTAGFADKAKPKAVLETESGNESFRQQVWDLGVDTGSGNPGAIGVNYVSSNYGTLNNVRIRSGDGEGFAGVGMDRAWTGPAFVKNVEVSGFDFGVAIGPGEYGPVFEGLTLLNQKRAGMRSVYGAPSVRSLKSVNTVPAFWGTESPNFVALIDADLSGGTPGTAAMQTQGDLYLRNVKTTGYARALSVQGTDVAGTSMVEYASTRYAPFGNAASATALNLPVQETPVPDGGPVATWFRFPDAADYGNLRRLQSYLDSMAAAGQKTLYFPFGVYFSYDEVAVRVPAGVERIVGNFSVVNSDSRGVNGGGLRLVVDAPSATPLVVEQFGYGVKIEHRASRTVVFKHGSYQYSDAAGSGDLFIEDHVGGPLVLRHPKRVWARQLNIETIGSRDAKTDNSAADLWVLGFKTEGGGPIFNVSGTGRTELLGGFMLPNTAETELPAFLCDASAGPAQMSLSYRYEAYDAGGVNRKHTVQYRELRNGQTRELRTDTAEISRKVGLLRCGG